MKVGVHKNLHRHHNNKGDWSLKNPKNFKLLGHECEVFLKDCSFKVRQSGVKLFREISEKSVHALAVGEKCSECLETGWVEISYHPAIGHFFSVHDEDQKPLKSAEFLWFTPFEEGWKLFAINPK